MLFRSKHPASVRVRAAVALLDTAMRAVEMGELAQRIQVLEEALEDAKQDTARTQGGTHLQAVERYA